MPKKKTALTIEERLQQALVPAEEQPYALPENWVWTYGKFMFKPMETKKPQGEFFYYIDIDAIDNKRQVVTEAKKINSKNAPSRASRKLHKGDTIFSLVRPYLRNIAYIDASLAECIASTGFYVCTPVVALKSKFLYQLMISSYVVDGLNKYMNGDNSPSIRKDDIENYPIPLPPLAEQQRIVDRIEELFAKLDEAKEKLEAVVDSFAVRKAAILHKAFTGELTQKWRKENGVELSLKESLINDFITKDKNAMKAGPFGSALKKSMYVKDGYKIYGQEQVISGNESIGDYYIDRDKYEELSSCKVQPGDILISLVGTVGKVLILSANSKAGIINPRLIKVTLDQDKMIPKFFKYYFESDYIKSLYKKDSHGSTMDVLNMGILKKLPFPKITLPEQHEIVRLIDSLLARERKAQKAAEQALASIELMKKAILAKAFRGELGTNRASEASAMELLKQVLEQEK